MNEIEQIKSEFAPLIEKIKQEKKYLGELEILICEQRETTSNLIASFQESCPHVWKKDCRKNEACEICQKTRIDEDWIL